MFTIFVINSEYTEIESLRDANEDITKAVCYTLLDADVPFHVMSGDECVAQGGGDGLHFCPRSWDM